MTEQTARCVCGHAFAEHRRVGGKCETKSGHGNLYGCPCLMFLDENTERKVTWFCGEDGCIAEAATPQELWEAQQEMLDPQNRKG